MVAAELVVLCGLQASGKSTYAQRHFAATHAYVSKDRMGRASGKDDRQARLVAEHLAAGRPTVVDNTNPTLEERRRLVELGRQHGAQIIGYWFRASVAESIARNAAREGAAVVPKVGIFSTAKRFQPPTPDEGYDELYIVRIRPDDGGFDVQPWNEGAA